MKHLPPLDRRTLMRAGAAFGSVALVGSVIAPALAAAPAAELPLPGGVIGWLVIEADGGGQVTVVQLDAQSRPVRHLAQEAIQSGASVAGAARQATAAVVRVAAAAWDVSPDACACQQGRIAHPASGRSVAFKIWTDFA